MAAGNPNRVAPDGDGDGLCDAVDPCTNPGGANTFVLTNPVPKIVLNQINTDTTPGNDHLSVVGAFFLPTPEKIVRMQRSRTFPPIRGS